MDSSIWFYSVSGGELLHGPRLQGSWWLVVIVPILDRDNEIHELEGRF